MKNYLSEYDDQKFIKIPHVFIKYLKSIDTSILYAYLIYKYKAYNKHNKLKNGYFYMTYETIHNDIGLSRYQQTKCIKTLIENGLISTKKGKYCRIYFKIHTDLETIRRVIYNIKSIKNNEILIDDNNAKEYYDVDFNDIENEINKIIDEGK